MEQIWPYRYSDIIDEYAYNYLRQCEDLKQSKARLSLPWIIAIMHFHGLFSCVATSTRGGAKRHFQLHVLLLTSSCLPTRVGTTSQYCNMVLQ